MKANLSKIAAILALMIGTMAIFAGGRVLLGTDPGYYVIDWLPVYNFTVGLITVLVTAVLIWRKSRHARPAVGATFAAHALVMLTLLTIYRDVVAPDSLVAMTVRIVVWLVILTLMIVAGKK
jgi:hypothetical protein